MVLSNSINHSNIEYSFLALRLFLIKLLVFEFLEENNIYLVSVKTLAYISKYPRQRFFFADRNSTTVSLEIKIALWLLGLGILLQYYVLDQSDGVEQEARV